ncbi:MAG: matrixin family metalloprotease [Phycisphaerales bacterium]|nr:matrixin family metalloprotease [Phycisphaerales bacterium]
MKNRNLFVTMTTLLAGTSGLAVGADGVCDHAEHAVVPVAIASAEMIDELAIEELARTMIHSLSYDEQKAIVEGDGLGADALDLSHFSFESNRRIEHNYDPDITPSEYRDLVVTPEIEAKMTEGQRRMVDAIVETLESGKQPPALCFDPSIDREVAFAINQMIEFRFTVLFQQTSRWTRTATDGSGLVQGDPTTLTYSFVPDGTFVPNLGIGLGSGNSALFAWLNGIYGSQANWQPLFTSVFDRWEELTGLSYVYEPNDDGSNTNSGIGVLGVRGDVRIAAYDFQNDGNGGVLAYNNFPQDGDMVFDAFDTFYNNTGSNSLRFRNVISHEHGHGLGMLHVCPANQTKLMEPFISTAYNGPQLDDILNGHRHYGDRFEPNNSPAQTTDLGNFDASQVQSLLNLSVDDNSDDDYFEINLTEPARITMSVTPDADEYQQGTQTQACNSGTNTDYDSIHNLRISIFAPGDVINPALVADSNGTGQDETLIYDAVSAGTYYIRVDASTSTNSVQRYQAFIVTNDLPFLGPLVSAAEPDAVDPGVETDFAVTIDPRDDTLVGGSLELFTRVNGGSFTSSPLVSNGGDNYTATLPAVSCDDDLEFYISIEGDTDGVQTLPAGGASDPFSAVVGTFAISFEDNFESNTGWLISGDVTNQNAGLWQRGVPNGDGSRGDAPEDADGSGACYLTGNGGPGSNTDVDGGSTVLTSPLFDVSGNPEATISYYRWFHNSFGDNANVETFEVELTDNNGASWTQLELVAGNSPESNGGWFQKSFRIADFVSTTSQVRVRFTAKDDIGAVIEAAVDGVVVSGLDCEDVVDDCQPDLNDDGELDFFDISSFLTSFGNGDPVADFNNDGELDFFDISAFLAAYSAGCP